VGYHLAHHADMTVPYRNLPRLHAALVEDGYVGDLEWPTYRALWRALRAA
jgi:fatty acid desaturase